MLWIGYKLFIRIKEKEMYNITYSECEIVRKKQFYWE
jgi:hypothetical protein